VKTLILPDIHLQWEKAQSIIDLEKPDKIICLGDYFDSFCETEKTRKGTAEWLKAKLAEPNFIGIIGNHDVSYAYPVTRHTACSGYEPEKKIEIRNILTQTDFDKLKWFHVLDDEWLLTHAGLSLHHIGGLSYRFFKSVVRWLSKQVETAEACIKSGQSHWLFRAGVSRCGSQTCGGITWCDFKEEFKPIEGISQIFGHTPLEVPTLLANDTKEIWDKEHEIDGCWNLDLDCKLNAYAIWEDGRLIVRKTEKQTQFV